MATFHFSVLVLWSFACVNAPTFVNAHQLVASSVLFLLSLRAVLCLLWLRAILTLTSCWNHYSPPARRWLSGMASCFLWCTSLVLFFFLRPFISCTSASSYFSLHAQRRQSQLLP